jgi:hypothetical protein
MRKLGEFPASLLSAPVSALLRGLDDNTYLPLPPLCGADLCALGDPEHQVFWEPLANAWLGLDARVRTQLIESRTRSLVNRALLTEETPGAGRLPGASSGAGFALAPELGLLLAARRRPSFIVATHPSRRLPAVSYYALGDESNPVRAIVQEIPDVPDCEDLTRTWGPLSLVFCYRLCTPAAAAGFLARWALKPLPAEPGQDPSPRTVTLLRPDETTSVPHQLAIQSDGTKARVAGANMHGPLDVNDLQRIMSDLITKGCA